ILTVVNLGVTIIEILSRVFFPFLNRRKNAFPKYRNMMLILVLLMSVCILISYRFIFWYLNITDDNAFWLLLTLVLGLSGYTLANIYGLNYFVVRRQDKIVMRNTVRASVIG